MAYAVNAFESNDNNTKRKGGCIRIKILAIDDEEFALESLTEVIREACPSDEVFSFKEPSKLLAFAKENDCHIAFLDVEMWGMNGLELALELKKINPQINIIFATAYVQYKNDAMDLRASGYVMKPVTKEAVEREIENLRHPIDVKASIRFYVQTFGNFEVFINGAPLKFISEKSKELFAFLIDRRGAAVTTAEIASVLWEDKTYDRQLKNKTQTEMSKMMKALRDNGVGDVIIKSWNQTSVDCEKISCDYYNLLRGDVNALNAFYGEYMASYSWAELTTAALMQKTGMG